jgi:putative flippase GtrA
VREARARLAPVRLPRWVEALVRPGRYALIGALGAAINNAIVILADRRGIAYPAAMLVSFVIITPLCYVLHSRFTFAEALSWSRLARFAVGVASSFPLSLATMAVLCTALRLPVAVGAPLATLLLFLWNYALARYSITMAKPSRLPKQARG